uniref:SFRICE_009467 n=1 Tax=Spodoptera frugiperda TaxID=7108 RepID=A0A2H1WR32_SPOFR
MISLPQKGHTSTVKTAL